jgi:UDP-GlcNAc3NAcA epimerase
MVKIVTIVGARPQFIKAAVVSRAIAESSDITEIIIHTGQHFDPGMSDIFFSELKIPAPGYNLGIGGGSHGQNTGRMIEAIEEILLKEKPDWVLVYGDTDSTLAGALAAKKLHIKLAHVEAGLRSFNMGMPEEINRILTDRISDILFCPTETAVKNLKNEGFDSFQSQIVRTGDVMYDAALFYTELSKKPEFMSKLHLNEFALCTIHRAENTDSKERLGNIIEALSIISETLPVVLPLHPRTVKKIKEFNLSFHNDNVYVIDPIGYLEIVWLLQYCQLVITDSGGLQKEAYFFKKACVTLRDETEWTELITSGSNQLVGANTSKIIKSFKFFLQSDQKSFPPLYGDGASAENIIKEIMKL